MKPVSADVRTAGTLLTIGGAQSTRCKSTVSMPAKLENSGSLCRGRNAPRRRPQAGWSLSDHVWGKRPLDNPLTCNDSPGGRYRCTRPTLGLTTAMSATSKK